MHITLELQYPCILFRDLDKNCLSYFQCKKTADCVVFEQRATDNWALHIFEMIKTVKAKEWEKIQLQFKGAYYNALSLAGYLGINERISEIKFYTCFLNDRISSDTISMRASLAKANPLEEAWRTNRFQLKCYEVLDSTMEKIQVSDDLTAKYCF